MGRARGRVVVRRIENAVSRQVTFSKRRRGLAKKARELAVLCDAEVALLVFSDKGKLHEFTTNGSVDQILDRYERCLLSEAGDVREEHPELQESMSYDNIKLRSRIEATQRSERNFMGEQLDKLTLGELQQLEHQTEAALRNIRSRKDSILLNSIRELQKKERMLMEQKSTLDKENAELDAYQLKNSTASSTTEAAPFPNLNTCCTDVQSDEPGPAMTQLGVASGGDLPHWMLQQ